MATKHDDDTVTVIGESVTIRGNLTGDEDLHVLGRVEGTLELDRTLVVAQSGIVKAELSVKNAVISGIVVGNVHASESVELTADGRMVGDITAPRVILVDGASFRGNIDMGDIENMPARPPRSERSAPRPMVSARTARPAPPVRESAREEAEEPATEAAPAAESDKTEANARPAQRTVVTRPPTPSPTPPAPASSSSSAGAAKSKPAPGGGGQKPRFLEPPKAKGLPKKQKKRVVVKRK